MGTTLGFNKCSNFENAFYIRTEISYQMLTSIILFIMFLRIIKKLMAELL